MSYHNWRPFEDARAYVRSLGLKNAREWRIWVKNAQNPDDIPNKPNMIYKGRGWESFGDWLGTGHIANKKKTFRPFPEARAFVRSLGLKNYLEWKTWVKSPERPKDIPTEPNKVYKEKGWAGLRDWLGSAENFKPRIFRPFEEAREYARDLKLHSSPEWRAWSKSGVRPNDIPANPEKTYKREGWAGFGDWLGTGHISSQKRVFRPFEEARIFIRSLGLKNSREWNAWFKSPERPDDIPSLPSKIYQEKGWAGLRDWLGLAENYKRKVFRPFEEAREYIQGLNLQNYQEWQTWAKSGARPDDIPSNPNLIYKEEGWVSLGDWLGTGHISSSKRVFRTFEKARSFVRGLGLKNYSEWRAWTKSSEFPDDIPIIPYSSYKDKGWVGLYDWLGIVRNDKRRVFRQFEEAREYVQGLGLKNVREWEVWAKSGVRPDDIPSNPGAIYNGKGWISFADWLGTS